jgi:hypothetical protein
MNVTATVAPTVTASTSSSTTRSTAIVSRNELTEPSDECLT